MTKQRRVYRSKEKKGLTDKQIKLLEELQIGRATPSERQWETSYQDVIDYKTKYGDLRIPNDYIGKSGTKTAVWIRMQRQAYRSGRLSEERMRKLSNIGVITV